MASRAATDSSISFLPRGAIIQKFVVAGHNIVLGFPSAEPYATAQFFGETIGRVANRIKDGLVQLNGKTYQLSKNNGDHSLHGGAEGWGTKTFSGPHLCTRNGKESVQFTYVSPDGEEGYPGTVELRVWYSAYEQQEDAVTKVVLEAEYEAELVGNECEETVINVTNHSYFNLTGGPTVSGTRCTLATDDYLPVDADGVPLGSINQFSGIEIDKTFTLGPEHNELDNCFVMSKDVANIALDSRSQGLKRLISMDHPGTKLHLDIFSTEPSFQFYTGSYVDVPESEHGPARPPNAGLCVEPGRFVNAINVPEWRNMALLLKGQLWGAKTVYKAWKA